MKKFACMIVGMAVLAAACQKKPAEITPVVSNPITIIPNLVGTKVGNTNFDAGDNIGLTIRLTKPSESSESSESSGTPEEPSELLYIENERLIYENGVFASSQNFWTDDKYIGTFMAYYPYNDTVMPSIFTIETDQSSGTSNSDLIIGRLGDVGRSSTSLKMTFHHMLSKITMNITNKTGGVIKSVSLSDVKNTCSIDYDTPKVTAMSGVEEITLCPVTAGSQYTAIIIPQTSSFHLYIYMTNGNLIHKIVDSKEYVAGVAYNCNVEVTPSDTKISFSDAITDWSDGGEVTVSNPTTTN